jgi:hypothetical protein
MGGVEGKVVVVVATNVKVKESSKPKREKTKKKQSRPEPLGELEPSDDEKRGEKQKPPIVFG